MLELPPDSKVRDSMPRNEGNTVPDSGTEVPRYAGSHHFFRGPSLEQVSSYDIALLGIPFDSGTSYRPGARFGPSAVRSASRHLRPGYHSELEISPFSVAQIVDAGDVAANPFDMEAAVVSIHQGASAILSTGAGLVSIGGDHSIALPLLRAVVERKGPVALVHFDAHLDTWNSYFGASLTHGTVFRRASEEGLLIDDHSVHIGIRGPLYDRLDLVTDKRLGFQTITAFDLQRLGLAEVNELILKRVGDNPVYISVDIDVLDPAFAPGTGTPEVGGLSSRELLMLLRGLSNLNIVAADVVEVCPAYDSAEVTALAAATVAYELTTLIAGIRSR